MNRTAWKIVGLACALTLACTPGVRAQQPPQPGDPPAYQDPPAAHGQEREWRRPPWPGRRGRQERELGRPLSPGMQGNMGMRLQYFLAWLTQQLNLNDVQRAQVQSL